ncbi:hypothetical protein UPYG_G00235800 [Umbra pygmaea]|uniref:Uncharacterized protein n=1 Tax=Umbra pygmaea TaxID=75934 RepID=A0ABD0X0F4_UMBPY
MSVRVWSGSWVSLLLICLCTAAVPARTIKNDIMPDVLNRTAEVTMITNEMYLEEYSNKTSKEYEEKVKSFTKEMMIYYQSNHIKYFTGIDNVILSKVSSATKSQSQNMMEHLESNLQAEITKSSLQVAHDIVLMIPNQIGADQFYDDVITEINRAIVDINSCTITTINGCPGFNVTKTKVEKETVDGEALCEKLISSDLIKYFQPYDEDGKWICVTECHPGHRKAINCNSGTCRLTKDRPSCYCTHTESTWYLGSVCNYPINKTGFYAGIGVTAGFVLVIVGVLTAFLLVNKQKVKRNKDNKGKIQWLEDDFKWHSHQARFENTAQPGAYDNPMYNREASKTYQPTNGPLTSYNSQQFSDRRHSPKYHPPQPQFQMNRMSNNQPIRINRPQIRSSNDM